MPSPDPAKPADPNVAPANPNAAQTAPADAAAQSPEQDKQMQLDLMTILRNVQTEFL